MGLIKNDIQYTIKFATENKETFMSILKERAKAKSKRELESYLDGKEQAEKRIKALDKIIQNLYEDMAIVKKYSDFDELTPEILRAYIDKVYIYEKQKVDGHYTHTVEIICNLVGAIDLPDFGDLLDEEN